jgi:replicative DNA helicase
MAEEFAVTPDYQAKVLALMASNSDFCNLAKEHLKVEYFSNKAIQWFFNKLTQSEVHLNPVLLKEELLLVVRSPQIAKDIDAYSNVYKIVESPVTAEEEKHIKDKISLFIRTQAMKRALEKSIELSKEHKYEEVLGVMEEAVSSGLDFEDYGYKYFSELENRIAERSSKGPARKLPTGIVEFDNLMYGGIDEGQVGLMVGGTGRGKSIFLQWVARTALLLNKKVIYFTYELNKFLLSSRFDSMFAKIRPQELNDYQYQVLNEISKLHQTYGDNLVIKHYPANKATVQNLESFVRRLAQVGFVPDLILIDYMDLIKPQVHRTSKIEETDDIMMAIIGFSQELKTRIWTATQLNRAGMTQDTPDEASMAGYVGKQYHADVVSWLAQTKDEQLDEIMRIWVSKNRNGHLGTIKLTTDYSYMTFFREQREHDGGLQAENNSGLGRINDQDASRDLQLLFQASEQESITSQK